jgi:starch synthase
MKQLKICYVSSEVVPFAKTGGLADVAGALPIAHKEMGHDVRVMMPNYKSINERKFVLREVIRLKEVEVELNNQNKMANGKTAFLPNSKVHVYFLSIPEYFDRKGFYVDPKSQEEFSDNAERFAYFSMGVLKTLKLLYWQPDIIHCNEWQTALIPFYLKTRFKDDLFFKNTKTVLSLHNLAYQGISPEEKASLIDIPEEYSTGNGDFEFYGKLNLLKGGILFADVINTVSEQYAEEITSSSEYGFGLEGVLKGRKKDLYGILNGVDYAVWSPDEDEHIPVNYDSRSLSRKVENKEELCEKTQLKFDPAVPVIGMISRLVDQKGFDLLSEIFDKLMKLKVQMVLLGEGEPKYQDIFKKHAKKYSKQFSLNLKFDDELAHLIEAGSDIFLMPSKFEPCGLNQIYSIKYGTVPVVRETGGLKDTIQNFNAKTGKGNGFIFKKYKSKDLYSAIKTAVDAFKDKKAWTKIQKNGMRANFSWETSAKKYVKLYEKAMKKK